MAFLNKELAMPVIPTLGRLRQENCCKFDESLDYIVGYRLVSL